MIEETVKDFLDSLPQGIIVVAAAKTRMPDEVKEAIRGGIKILGYNYVQEAERMFQEIGHSVSWHMIGHLQKNKVKKAVKLFDVIETIDSLHLAEAVDKQCTEIGKMMPVLIEINSGREPNKTGVLPEEIDELVEKISHLAHLQVQGLMTMGPFSGDPENARPYFKETRLAFDRLRQTGIRNIDMHYLSMGMSNSYQVAIEEGANMIRIGTKLFGPRNVD